MYSAIMTGLGNYLKNHWGYYKEKEEIDTKYGGSDSYWNKHNLDRLQLPGLIYAASNISFPKGLTSKVQGIYAGSNTTNTLGLEYTQIPISIDITLGMIGKDEEQHFWHIHKYIELGAGNAEFEYRVVLPELNEETTWMSSIGNFGELSPPPSGKEFSTYDPEGQLYTLEGTFTINSMIVFNKYKKLIRAVLLDYSDSQLLRENIITNSTKPDTI